MSEISAAQLNALFDEDKYFEIIALLEERELDYPLALSLTRAYINAATKAHDPISLLSKAHSVLDHFAIDGRDDPNWLFYKGFALFKEGLTDDAKIRFEHALKFVQITDSKLLERLKTMVELCEDQVILRDYPGISRNLELKLLEMLNLHFGQVRLLCTTHKVKIYWIPPTAEHDYHLLVTQGLCGRIFANPDGSGSECHELCLPLHKSYDFEKGARGPCVMMLLDLIEHLIVSRHYIGFGYQVSGTCPAGFDSVMLINPGTWDTEASQLKISAKEGGELLLSYLQVLPLKPFESAFREHHTAFELLEVFKDNRLVLTPFIEQRPDVCETVRTSLN